MVSSSYSGCVYLAINKVNGTIYIGKTIHGLRWRKKTHEKAAAKSSNGMSFHKAIRKYGHDAFAWSELYVSTDDYSLCRAEISLISDYRAYGFRLYNMTDGGEGVTGRVLSEVSLEKMRNRTVTEEHREKIRASWTPERLAAQAEKMRNRIVSDKSREASKLSAAKNFGTEGAIEKMRRAKTGKKREPWSEERRAKHAASWQAKREAGYKRPAQHVEDIAERQRQRFKDPQAREYLKAAGLKGALKRWEGD